MAESYAGDSDETSMQPTYLKPFLILVMNEQLYSLLNNQLPV